MISFILSWFIGRRSVLRDNQLPPNTPAQGVPRRSKVRGCLRRKGRSLSRFCELFGDVAFKFRLFHFLLGSSGQPLPRLDCLLPSLPESGQSFRVSGRALRPKLVVHCADFSGFCMIKQSLTNIRKAGLHLCPLPCASAWAWARRPSAELVRRLPCAPEPVPPAVGPGRAARLSRPRT